MTRELTITIDDLVYQGLCQRIGKRRISKFLEDLIRPHVTDSGLETAYLEMAADESREAEAAEWVENLAGDVADDPR